MLSHYPFTFFKYSVQVRICHHNCPPPIQQLQQQNKSRCFITCLPTIQLFHNLEWESSTSTLSTHTFSINSDHGAMRACSHTQTDLEY